MREFFDTSALIAAMMLNETHHAAAAELFAAAAEPVVAMHSLVECFDVLTGSPQFAVPPDAAARMIRENLARCDAVPLSRAEIQTVLDGARKLGIRGGLIFDALIMACARKTDAAKIYTTNARHFAHVAPDLRSRICGLEQTAAE